MTVTNKMHLQARQNAEAKIAELAKQKKLLSAELTRMENELPETEVNDLVINAVECQIGRINEKIRLEMQTVDHAASFIGY